MSGRIDVSESAIVVEAIKEFNERTRRDDGELIVGSLVGGLTLLRDSLFHRLHDDLKRIVGEDSMFARVSELKAQQATKAEISLYEIVESAVAAENLGQVGSGNDWYWQWLTRLTFNRTEISTKVDKRITGYLAVTPQQRRLTFTNVLVRVLPGSRRAPLILFDLFPLSVQIVTAVALGEEAGASELRKEQQTRHAAIGDCRSCQGRVLASGEQCQECGNPLWKHEWLVAE